MKASLLVPWIPVRGGAGSGEDEVAAKHDGKHARANMWVTHQNLARQKGGRPGYQFQEKGARTQKGAPAAGIRKPAPASAATETADESAASTVTADVAAASTATESNAPVADTASPATK